MSAFIKQIRETYKRRYGFDPVLEPRRKPPVNSTLSLAEMLRKYPAMSLDPDPFEAERLPERGQDIH